MTDRMIVAVPSEGGGLDAVRSGHFGQAPAFTLVSVEDGRIGEARDIVNPPHVSGGCMSTVQLLLAQGVDHAVVAGIGGGPMNGLSAAGVAVYHSTTHSTVREAVAALLGEGLPRITAGSCSHHHR